MEDNMLDKILSAVLDNKSEIVELKAEMKEMKDVQAKTYNRIDGFLVMVDRHEAEIAALRSAHERLEDRLVVLEKKMGVA